MDCEEREVQDITIEEMKKGQCKHIWSRLAQNILQTVRNWNVKDLLNYWSCLTGFFLSPIFLACIWIHVGF